MTKKKTRQWSRAFTAQTERNVRLSINRVPPTLKDRFEAKCKREDRSMRHLILTWVENWTAGRRPDEPEATKAEKA